eukprot:Em0024g133a
MNKTPCTESQHSSSDILVTPNKLHSEDNVSFLSSIEIGNTTPNHMAARQAEIVRQQTEQAEEVQNLKEGFSELKAAQKQDTESLKSIDQKVQNEVHKLYEVISELKTVQSQDMKTQDLKVEQRLKTGLKKQADESHEGIRYLRGALVDSERWQTDAMVICGAVFFGFFLVLLTSYQNEVDQKMSDLTAAVQGLEERIAVYQHVLETEIGKNVLMQAKLDEYHVHMQNWSDAILSNFTRHHFDIQLTSQETSLIKDELYQSQSTVRQNINMLSKNFEEKAAELNKAIDEQLKITQKWVEKATVQQIELDEQQEINKQQMLIQQHLVMTLKEVQSINGMSLYSPETIIVMHNFSQYAQNETSEWFSPPFYTHWAGYKLCLKAYPNGYGNAKRTHLSWFIYLMKGEFDASLVWPFSGSITVQLINWIDEDKHSKEKTAVFDSNSDTTANSRVGVGYTAAQGVGFIKFVALKELYNPATGVEYLQNDCLKFKVSSIEVFSK